jgi:hypothetical protein
MWIDTRYVVEVIFSLGFVVVVSENCVTNSSLCFMNCAVSHPVDWNQCHVYTHIQRWRRYKMLWWITSEVSRRRILSPEPWYSVRLVHIMFLNFQVKWRPLERLKKLTYGHNYFISLFFYNYTSKKFQIKVYKFWWDTYCKECSYYLFDEHFRGISTLFKHGEQHTKDKHFTSFSFFWGVNESAHNGHISFHLLSTYMKHNHFI